MQFGVTLPYDEDPRDILEMACDAEAAGWNGVFVWDGITGGDPWVLLAAIAAKTERIKLATMLTPISRRRPWKLAQEAATLDQRSGGRVILPVGLGAPETGFDKFGEVTDRKVRAEMLDEGIEVLSGLWSGEPFTYDGTHYQVSDVTFEPLPLQRPRVPIWVVGAWRRMKSMQRVLACDGFIPYNLDGNHAETTPDELREMADWISENRTATTQFDILWEANTPGDDPARCTEIVQPWANAGATWWLESVWDGPRTANGLAGMQERIRQGPPKI